MAIAIGLWVINVGAIIHGTSSLRLSADNRDRLTNTNFYQA
jgi:hypothetical protein